MRIAVSGHRGLSPAVATLVDKAIRGELDRISDDQTGLVGLSCLADGADQIFASVVLDRGGHLEVVVPAEAYRDGLPNAAKPAYDALLSKASQVHRMGHRESTASAHMDASIFMIDNADQLFAVWDGLPARAYGGTADVVAYARDRALPVTVIWPENARRD